MKTLSIVWSLLLTTLFFASCETEDLATPMSGNEKVFATKRGPQNGTAIYGGQASGLNAVITTEQNGTVVSHQTILSQTSLLPTSGGTLEATHGNVTLEGFITIDTLTATASGQNNQTVSQSSASNINITVDGIVISADYVSATAITTCGSATGSSLIQNLVVNGTPITITGTPNQAVYLSAGAFILINEQTSSKKIKAKNINVSALHIIIPGSADIRIATARAEIKC